jgi:ribonuclease III
MKFEQLSNNLGYVFQDKNLLKEALRHRSMGKISNERLEFLGDAALNFIIAAELFRLYPEIKEGDLSRLRANLVNGEELAELANELQIGEHIQFGSGELKSGGAKRKSILADTTEAIIGAIYLDGGIDACKERVLTWFNERLLSATQVTQKDPKTRLQELLQMCKMPLPVYDVAKITGVAHAQIFHVECKVAGIEFTTVGVGPSKRVAERSAAAQFLEAMSNNAEHRN